MLRRLTLFFRRLNRRREDGEKAAPRTWAQRLRGWLLYGVYLVAAAAGIFFVGELVLLIAYAATGSEALETLSEQEEYSLEIFPEYPNVPENWTKVAIFGGSTAAGDHSTRAFSSVIQYELQSRFPGRRIFVKNYARPGAPFHRHEAEYVKLLIEKYDFIIIYCGNNEAENYFDDVGYWRKDEYKDAKDLIFRYPVETRSEVLNVLELHSRIFALITRAKSGIKRIDAPISKNKPADYDEIEEADALPAKERKKLLENFERDVVEICELAAKHKKQVLLAVTATHETWPPCCSYFQKSTTAQQRKQWQEIYDRAMKEFEAENYRAALPLFEEARKIDSGVAILNHRIGLCYLNLGDQKTGRRYLRQAIDQDGFYSRSVSALHDKAKELSEKYDRLHHVDVVAKMHQVLSGDITDKEIFSDHCHMRLLGHVIVGRAFLEPLLQMEPFKSWRDEGNRAPGETDWRLLNDFYHEVLGVSGRDEAQLAMGRIRFFFGMAYWTAYPERCYEQIDEQIDRLETYHDGSPSSRALVHFLRAWLSLRRRDYAAATEQLNVAWAIDPQTVQTAMGWAAYYRYVDEEFTAAGIVFARDKALFVWNSP